MVRFLGGERIFRWIHFSANDSILGGDIVINIATILKRGMTLRALAPCPVSEKSVY
jgi:hypothetical protein